MMSSLASLLPLFVLFAQTADPQPSPPSPPPPPLDAAALQKALQQDAAASAPAPPPPAAADTPLASQAAVQRPGSSLLNPALSVIVDMAYGYYGKSRSTFSSLRLPVAGDDPAPQSPGFSVPEVELAASAAIDPYLDANVFLTIPNLDGLEVEEAYLVTTSLPANLQLKAGTFRSQMGRNNTQHLHLQYFTRRPLMTALLFGTDGLRGPGLQASVLLPLPWFATLYAEAFSLGGSGEAGVVTTFGDGGDGTNPRNLTFTAVLEQSWDVGENTTVVLGLNAATGHLGGCTGTTSCTGPTGPQEARTLLYGGDLYVKWKPANVAQTYASVQWTTEYFARKIDSAMDGEQEGALYTEPVVQVARRWYLGARLDLTGLPDGLLVPRRNGYAGSITFAPSEFSRFRLFAQELTGKGVPSSTIGFLQAEFSMGAHGAHPF